MPPGAQSTQHSDHEQPETATRCRPNWLLAVVLVVIAGSAFVLDGYKQDGYRQVLDGYRRHYGPVLVMDQLKATHPSHHDRGVANNRTPMAGAPLSDGLLSGPLSRLIPPPPPPLPPAPPGICSRGWCDGKHPPDAVTVQAPPRQPPHPGSRLPGMLDGIDSGNRPLVPRIQMSSSQRAAYLRAVYGEGVPASATLDNFRLIDAAAMQVAGVAVPAVPCDGLCPAEVGWPFSGHHGSFDLPCTLYLYDGNNDVPRVPFRSNQWAEVARTKPAGSRWSFQGAWYYAARGSGIFINMGNTRAYPTHAVAMRDLLPDETFSMQGIIDRGRKDKDYQIYERLFKKAHSMGIDTLQFTQTCNTVCSQEIEIIETGGHGKYVCAVAVQMATGWNASKPCACSANFGQVQCGQPRNGGQCSAWLGKFNKQKRLVSEFTCTGRVSAGKFGGQDCASSHAQVARDAGAAKAAEWCGIVGCSGSSSSAATGGGGHCSGTCTNETFAGKACDQAWATVRRDSGRIDNADKWCLSARGCTLDPKRSGHLQQYIVKKGFSNSDLYPQWEETDQLAQSMMQYENDELVARLAVAEVQLAQYEHLRVEELREDIRMIEGKIFELQVRAISFLHCVSFSFSLLVLLVVVVLVVALLACLLLSLLLFLLVVVVVL